MKLNLPSPPLESFERAAASLSALATRRRFGATRLRNAKPEQISLTAPHEMFEMDLAHFHEKPTRVIAQSTGWRYMLEVDARVVATAHMTINHEFSHVNSGPIVSETIRAMNVAEALGFDDVAELRMLSVPGLQFTSVWLKPVSARTDDDDVLIPIAPTPHGIRANNPYTARKLLELLHLQIA